METQNRFFRVSACLLTLSAAFAAACCLGLRRETQRQANAGQTTPERQARQILDAVGLKGGLVVHIGCGDGRLTAALAYSAEAESAAKAGCADESYLVHGLDEDPVNVEKARERIRSLGLYGKVSVDSFDGKRLPYIDNLVNLVVAENLGDEAMTQVMRVLAPNGVAYIKEADRVLARNGVAYIKGADVWIKATKPWPKEMDEWTHYLHDPSNNAVSHDVTIEPPRHLQWVGSPRYSRHHDHMSGASAMVSAAGRLYYIFDHGNPLSVQLPSKWLLVARDAFNGAILWRRDIGPWFSQMQRLKSGPSNLPRRLVAIDEAVYVTLALDAPVTALDAATGQTRKTYDGTKGADEILFLDGVLFLVVNREGHSRSPFTAWTEQKRTVMAVKADTGEVLWEKTWPWVVPGCMALDNNRVAFFDGERVVALDQKTGDILWQSEVLGKRDPVPVYFSPCLVLYEDLVLFSGADPDTESYHADNGKTMYAISAERGETLWKEPHPPSGYRSAEDILVAGGLIWTADIFNSRELRSEQTGTVWGRDPRTGQVKVEFKPDVDTHWFHHRCYRAKATEDYLLTSRTGIEFVDIRNQHWTCHHWVRGACLYGIMPANGMIYTPPHPCACYLEAKLYGFNALAGTSASRRVPRQVPQEGRLEQGPAYGNVTAKESAADWPTYRCDAARSGYTKASVPVNVGPKWQSKLGGRLSSLVVGEGKVFVASVDTHTVHGLDADSGEVLWSYMTGGRVDSPPTVWQGRVLFGSTDGYVYCLRADDGALAWRFRAAPRDRRMCNFEQIESVWPVHGSVLIRDGELWCVAGRSMFVDGGLRLLRLDPASGRLIDERIMDDKVPGSEDNLQVVMKGLNMPVALPDILSADDKYVYMRSQRFDFDGVRQEIEVPTLDVSAQWGEGPHLFSPTGFLDDIWWHRSYWVYGRVWKSGAGGYSQAGRVAPAGKPMVFNDTTIYGYGRKPQYYRWTTPMEYQLFATQKRPKRASTAAKKRQKRGTLGRAPGERIAFDWTEDVPILVRAMVLAKDTLFIAGAPDVVDEEQSLKTFDQAATQKQLARQVAVYEGSEGAMLWAVSAADGRKLAAHKLKSMPVFDGMAAAHGRLYLATKDGRVLCLAEK